uniref:Uncharacterized protein n=1 Tax=Siphoviridae sp. ctBLh2 TaxID=2827803 RepID=A0A8S5S372_9CAUD|nr:MAG TPA: hypothetical protein [Siphoviridae sp. ctBLh2]
MPGWAERVRPSAQSASAFGEVEAGVLWRRQVVSVTNIHSFFNPIFRSEVRAP